MFSRYWMSPFRSNADASSSNPATGAPCALNGTGSLIQIPERGQLQPAVADIGDIEHEVRQISCWMPKFHCCT